MRLVSYESRTSYISLFLLFLFVSSKVCNAGLFKDPLPVGDGDGGGDDDSDAPLRMPKELGTCNGIFLTYSLTSREKEYPHVKNVSKQAWAFKAEVSLFNGGDEELKGWQMFIGFQHKEILVSVDGAVPVDADDFPAPVGNGTTITGSGNPDLKTAISTANDYTQMAARVKIKGTQFGLGMKATPMPKTIRLMNDGFKCPAATRKASRMTVCCRKDPKVIAKIKKKTKYPPRRYGDLTISYDVLQVFQTSYFAQVTMDNNHPLGRLDHWNLTFEWQGGEFINTLKGAFAPIKDPTECLYGKAGKYYGQLDFTEVANCQKRPIISDLPSQLEKDEKIGNLPWCCKNGTVLPPLMDKSKSRSLFQMQVFKLPPDDNRTAITPPMKWNIDGVINPKYKCGPPIRVDPQVFPDPTGLKAIKTAIASWQISCNMTKPLPQEAKCCVSFSAYYNESAIPCPTCACGCDDTRKCSAKSPALLIPAEALLVPFANRTKQQLAWAKLKKFHVPHQMPCADNCPVSINWHVNTDHKGGWSARMTLFNWEDYAFDDWFTAVEFKRNFDTFEEVYSFNGTRIPGIKTIFFQGLKDFNYLAGETNGTHEFDPRVPGKQQTVLAFNKKHVKNFDITRDGFPTKVYFNGMECAMPKFTPTKNAAGQRSSSISVLVATFIAFMTFLVMTDRLY